jgi:hypothetical protein
LLTEFGYRGCIWVALHMMEFIGVFGVGSELKHYFSHLSYLFIAAGEFTLSEPPERDSGSHGDSSEPDEGVCVLARMVLIV